MKDRIIKSVFWIVWSRGALQMLSLLTTLLVARLLSPGDYGLMAMVGVWTTTIAMLADMGLGAAIVQFRDLDERELNTCFWLTLGATLLGYGLLFVAAPAIAGWFKSPPLAPVLRVAALTLPLIGLRQVPDALLRKRLELDKIAQAEILATLVIIPVTLSLAWAGYGVWALVAGSLTQSLTHNAVIVRFGRWWPGWRVGSPRLTHLFRYSLSALGARMSWALYEQVDVFVLGRFVSDQSLGLYSMARQLASMPVTKVSVVVNQIAGPVMAQLQVDGEAMRTSFLRMMRLVGCITIPLCVVLLLEADDLVGVALSAKWAGMVPLLQLFAAGALLRWLEVLLPPVLFARYRVGFVFWWTMTLLVCMPFVFWAGASWKGAIGVALGWVVIYPLFVLWMARESLKELGIGWSTIWEQVRPIVAVAAAMAVGIVVIRQVLPGEHAGVQWGRLIAASTMGLAIYGWGIYRRGGPVAGEFGEVTGWLFRKPREA